MGASDSEKEVPLGMCSDSGEDVEVGKGSGEVVGLWSLYGCTTTSVSSTSLKSHHMPN